MTTPTKPYLVRAIWEWCTDQGYTPYLAVTVDSRTRVPREHVREGQIVLNVGGDACHQLVMGNEEITFQARFNGNVFSVLVPIDRVAAIYARENGQGMAFEVHLEGEDAPTDGLGAMEMVGEMDADEVQQSSEASVTDEIPRSPPPGRPHLTRVK
jgi:stringent starvation protein B